MEGFTINKAHDLFSLPEALMTANGIDRARLHPPVPQGKALRRCRDIQPLQDQQ